MTRRGLVLPAAIAAVATVGLLVAGLFHLALLEVRAGRNSVRLAQARALAPAALLRGLDAASPAAAAAMAPGDSVPFTGDEVGVGSYSGGVLALGNGLFLVHVRVTGGARRARREAHLVARLCPPGAASALRPLGPEPGQDCP